MTCDCENKTGAPREGMNTWGCGCNKMPEEPNRKGVVKFCDLCDPCNKTVSNVRLCAFVVPTLEEGRYFKNSFIFAQDEDAVYYISDDRSEIPFGSRPKFINDFDPNDPEAKFKNAVVYDVKNHAGYVYDDEGNRAAISLAATPINSIAGGDGITVTVNGGDYTVEADNTLARQTTVDNLTLLVTSHTTSISDLQGRVGTLEGTVQTLGTDLTHVHDLADDANELAVLARGEAQAAQQTATNALTGLAGKQDTLTAGNNISITNNEISATDTTYGAFVGTDGINDGAAGLVPAPAAADAGKVLGADGTWTTPQGYTAGANITINGDEISATDTTYSDFVGTDGSDDGTAGLVPAPTAADDGKFLKADGTWDTAGSAINVVQTTGTSATDVMSQVAASQMVYPSGYEVSKGRIAIGVGATTGSTGRNAVAIGPYAEAINEFAVAIGGGNSSSFATKASNVCAIAVGFSASAGGQHSTAIGDYSRVPLTAGQGDYSVALGYQSRTSRDWEVSVGSSDSNPHTRYVANVTDPDLPQDAATKNYVDSFYPVGSVYASTSQTAPTFVGTWNNIGSQTIGSSTVYYYERTA